jgi:hypothetical protein
VTNDRLGGFRPVVVAGGRMIRPRKTSVNADGGYLVVPARAKPTLRISRRSPDQKPAVPRKFLRGVSPWPLPWPKFLGVDNICKSSRRS